MPTTRWTDAFHALADQPHLQPRGALWLGAVPSLVGSIEASLAQRMCDARLPLRPGDAGWHVTGHPDESLAELAHWLHAQGLCSRWRNELLAVTDAVRPLGITTFAVHLVVRTPAGGVWVQQRALDKSTDPGLWDTTMGGLRSAAETVHDTLERETWEEAGLRLADLQGLAPRGRVTVRRPVADGYMVEHIDTFEARLPPGHMPVNQDGEVAGFECLDVAALRRRLQQDRFTLEAALVLLRCLPELA
jgi:8-oxo-dGTP pyrophosphatase MutT (NUDIX family)